MMVCRDVIDFLADYLSGALPEDVVTAFEKHLAACRSCNNYLTSYRETIRMAKASSGVPLLHAEEPPTELVEAILAAVKKN